MTHRQKNKPKNFSGIAKILLRRRKDRQVIAAGVQKRKQGGKAQLCLWWVLSCKIFLLFFVASKLKIRCVYPCATYVCSAPGKSADGSQMGTQYVHPCVVYAYGFQKCASFFGGCHIHFTTEHVRSEIIKIPSCSGRQRL